MDGQASVTQQNDEANIFYYDPLFIEGKLRLQGRKGEIAGEPKSSPLAEGRFPDPNLDQQKRGGEDGGGRSAAIIE